MRNSILCFVVLVIVIGCSSGSDISYRNHVSPDKEYCLRDSVLNDSYLFSWPHNIFILDSLIIIHDSSKQQYAFHIFNRYSGSHVADFGVKGRGPGEVLNVASVNLFQGSLVAYDVSLKKIVEYNIKDILSFDAEPWKEKTLANISDSAITAVKDIVISIEYDKVYDEFRYVAKIKDFCSNYADNGYSEERYGSYKYYEELRNKAWKEVTRNINSRKMGTFIYSFMTDKYKRKLGNQGWGYIVFNLSRSEGLLKYSLTIRASDGIKVGRVFSKKDCWNIFHALDTFIFNSWYGDIDNLEGAIKFRLLYTN